MNQVRYRTEAFSGSQVRDAAEVLAFEVFELNATDILENLINNILRDNQISNRLLTIKDHLDGINSLDYIDDLSDDERVAIFREVLAEIKKETGVEVNYALWLADKDAVTDREWYGKYMEDEADFDSYEIGPIVLVDIGYDGTLYGYTDLPISLESQIVELGYELTDIINEMESDNLSPDRQIWLDNRYLEVDKRMQEIAKILSTKLEKGGVKLSLDDQIKSAAHLGAESVISVAEYTKDADIKGELQKSDNLRNQTLDVCYGIPGYNQLPKDDKNKLYDLVKKSISLSQTKERNSEFER